MGKSPDPIDWNERELEVGRRRDQAFVREVVRRGLPESDSDFRELAAACWPHMEDWSQPRINKKIKQKLRQPDIKQALRGIYEDVVNFSPAEAFALHAAHMRSGNWSALKHYFDVTIGTAEKKVRMDTRSVNVHVAGGGVPDLRDGPPPTRARAIGASRVALSSDVIEGGGEND